MHRLMVCLISLIWVACAQDWPQWRGPQRDGVAVGFQEPKAWPEKLTRKWKVTVGEGHSSPVVAGGVIYLHSREANREVVRALRPQDGSTIWQQSYDAPYTVNPAAESHGKGVKSTPAVAGGRIVTLGISGTLSCFDAASGKLAWRKEFGTFGFGVATSPLIDRGMVIVYSGDDRQGALTAFDLASGAERWSVKGDGPAYASPIVADLAGTRQIVTQSRQKIIGVAEANGELLWQIPFQTVYEQNIVTPAVDRDTLVFSGTGHPIFGVKLSHDGSGWQTHTAWENKELALYMSSPVVSGHLLYGFSERKRGQFFCLRPSDGSTLWTSEGRQGDSAAIVAASSVLLLLTPDATLTVARQNDKAFQPVRKYTVADSPTWAHPVIVGRGILIKDASTLALWEPEQ